MLDLDKMIRAGVDCAGESKVILAAPYDLSPQLCHSYANRGLIGGYVAARAHADAKDDPLAVGEWIDRDGGRWRIRGQGLSTLVFLGSTEHIRTRMLMEAKRAGVHRIIVVHVDGTISADINVWPTLFGRVKTLLIRRFLTSDIVTRGAFKPLNRIFDVTFDKAYELLHDLLSTPLRLPPDAFVPGRVLIISGSLGPGGAERQLAYTAAGLTKSKKYEVFVGCNYLDPPADFFRSYVEGAGAKVVRVPYDAPEFRTPELAAIREKLVRYDPVGLQNLAFAVFHYALLIRSVRPSIVHTWMDYCNVLGGIAADLVGVPALIQGGRSMAPDHFAIFQPYMRPGYSNLYKRRNSIFLNNSQAGANDYARWLGLPSQRFRVIHNGFDFPDKIPRRTRIAERRKHKVPAKAFVIGSIIRFSEEKRPKLLIDMARLLLQKHPDLKFLIFGAGPMIEEMRTYVESFQLADAIKLPGFTKDAWRSLAAMDVFVLTSRMEGLPNVLIEAEASGLPIVCTAVGGMSETYVEGVTGFGVPAATPAALAQAVSRLVGDPKLHSRMSKQAFRYARETFGIDRMISHTLKAYGDAEELTLKIKACSPKGAH
jgi:glycosyltransferase involved in cell wall biosynthesis